MGPFPEPQNYDPATPLSWTPDGRQYEEEAMGELDRKEEAARGMKDAIVLMRGLGYTDEKIIDICATIMAETVPAAQIDMHLGVVRTESREEFEAEMRKYQAE